MTDPLHVVEPDEEPDDPFADIVWDAMPVLRPGSDFHDDTLYMTFPMERKITKKIGKGKAAEEVTRVETHTMCVTSNRRWFWYTEPEVIDNGFRWPPTGFIQEVETRWPKDKMRDFLTDQTMAEDPTQLYLDLRAVYEEYVEYAEPIFYDLMPLYIMATYVFRLFPAFGYLHFNGTAASGKSQNLKLLKSLGFNCIWASNMSTASLFRRAEGCPGVICLDEAESFEGERGEELRRLLNAGYKAGEPAIRTEPGENGAFVVKHYETFGPKALASINPLEPVIQSRCIIVPMQPASLKEIPEFNAESERWDSLRHRLYLWAMSNALPLRDVYNDWRDERRWAEARKITNRYWEISQPFIVLAEHVGGIEKSREVIAFFETYFAAQQAAAEEIDRQRMLLKVLPEVLRDLSKDMFTFDNKHFYRLKDIHDAVADKLDEDVKEYYKTKATGKHLTALGFRGRKIAKGGTLVHIDETELRDQFAKRHVTPFEEDTAWLAGELSYVERRSTTALPGAAATLWGAEPPEE